MCQILNIKSENKNAEFMFVFPYDLQWKVQGGDSVHFVLCIKWDYLETT